MAPYNTILYITIFNLKIYNYMTDVEAYAVLSVRHWILSGFKSLTIDLIFSAIIKWISTDVIFPPFYLLVSIGKISLFGLTDTYIYIIRYHGLIGSRLDAFFFVFGGMKKKNNKNKK